jgi:hypothetical protein
LWSSDCNFTLQQILSFGIKHFFHGSPKEASAKSVMEGEGENRFYTPLNTVRKFKHFTHDRNDDDHHTNSPLHSNSTNRPSHTSNKFLSQLEHLEISMMEDQLPLSDPNYAPLGQHEKVTFE